MYKKRPFQYFKNSFGYCNERNIILRIFYNMEKKNKNYQKADIDFKILAAKCVKALKHYLLDSDETIKQYFKNEVNEKLEKQDVFISYISFIKYLKIIENEKMNIGNQLITARILIENIFNDNVLLRNLWRVCDGNTFIYDEPLDNYRAYKRELSRKKREYY